MTSTSVIDDLAAALRAALTADQLRALDLGVTAHVDDGDRTGAWTRLEEALHIANDPT